MVKLSAQARMLWGKTCVNAMDEQRGEWLPLYVHMHDSARVGHRLWREWLPTAERRLITDAVGGDDAAAETLVVWLAGVHDVGKATPNFQCKAPERAEEVRETGLDVPPRHMMQGRSCPHSFMGEIILDAWLEGRAWEFPNTYSCVVGGHHGAPPSSDGALYGIQGIKAASSNFPNEVLGDDEWQAVQNELLDWMFVLSGMNEHEAELSYLGLIQPVEVLLTGFVIMADWIASNTDFFPLSSGPMEVDELRARADTAWESLALPAAWRAPELVLKPRDGAEDLFHARFTGLPEDAHLRPAHAGMIP